MNRQKLLFTSFSLLYSSSYLLSMDAQVQTKSTILTPDNLCLAVTLNNSQAVEILLRNQISPDTEFSSADIFAPRRTVLMDAALKGNVTLVKLLLHYGANPNYLEDINSPLCLAALGNHLAIVKCLLKAGAHINTPLNLRDSDDTALYRAALRKHTRLVRLLLSYGATVNTSRTLVMEGIRKALQAGTATELFISCITGNYKKLSKILASGVDLAISDQEGFTALHWAVVRNDLNAVALLLKHTKNQEQSTNFTWLPTYLSNLVYGTPNYSLDIDQKNLKGHTALMLALKRNNCQCINLLLSAQANKSLVDGKNRTTLEQALKHGYKEAFEHFKPTC